MKKVWNPIQLCKIQISVTNGSGIELIVTLFRFISPYYKVDTCISDGNELIAYLKMFSRKKLISTLFSSQYNLIRVAYFSTDTLFNVYLFQIILVITA